MELHYYFVMDYWKKHLQLITVFKKTIKIKLLKEK